MECEVPIEELRWQLQIEIKGAFKHAFTVLAAWRVHHHIGPSEYIVECTKYQQYDYDRSAVPRPANPSSSVGIHNNVGMLAII